MAHAGVAFLGRRCPVVIDHEHTDARSQGGCVLELVNRLAQLVSGNRLTMADFVQGVPHGGFKSYAGATPADADVAIDERAGTAACRPGRGFVPARRLGFWF